MIGVRLAFSVHPYGTEPGCMRPHGEPTGFTGQPLIPAKNDNE
jgi:hypothetical protein